LYKAAEKRGVTLRLGCPVVFVDEKAPSVTVKGGEILKADIVIGADGMASLEDLTSLLTCP
jgi:2-polyprenyl-6-methoxyphenol hydroxylase-like FAD-dependent oxidoreductase